MLIAALARQYAELNFGYDADAYDMQPEQDDPVTDLDMHMLLSHAYHSDDHYFAPPTTHSTSAAHPPAQVAVLPSHVSAAEAHYLLASHPPTHPLHATSHFSNVYAEQPQYHIPHGKKRPREESFNTEMTPHAPSHRISGSHDPFFRPAPQDQILQHHHHQLPGSRAFPPEARESASKARDDELAPSMVGQEGMPPPAPRPRGPKLKFTRADDALLVQLKEAKHLTWKQIADFFPGRTSGTLQVRYCTKLKAKTSVWSDEMVDRLRTAMAEYDSERWRVVASKVGNGFSAAACRDKALELDGDADDAGDVDDLSSMHE